MTWFIVELLEHSLPDQSAAPMMSSTMIPDIAGFFAAETLVE